MADKIEMCWIDMETTGLDARNCIPLEVGLRLTDKDGWKIAEQKWLVWEPGEDWAIKMMYGASDPFVGPMHEKSGLWDDLVEARGKTTLTRDDLDNAMCEFLTEHEVPFTYLPMAGSSIGSLDRPFALEHFPDFNRALSYRNIDISSIKELCKMHNPGLWEALRPIMGDKEDSKHRVLEDIDASIGEYELYLENFLMVEDD